MIEAKVQLENFENTIKRLIAALGDTTMTAIETIAEHKKEIEKRYGVKKIGVFGSYARREQKEMSDIDLLVEFDKPTFDNFMDLLALSKNPVIYHRGGRGGTQEFRDGFQPSLVALRTLR